LERIEQKIQMVAEAGNTIEKRRDCHAFGLQRQKEVFSGEN